MRCKLMVIDNRTFSIKVRGNKIWYKCGEKYLSPEKLLDKRSWLQIVGRFSLRSAREILSPRQIQNKQQKLKKLKVLKNDESPTATCPFKSKAFREIQAPKNSNIY